jgi:DegV family protein with EDD domain
VAVKIVTDSISDLPEIVKDELGITVVPMMVNFGEETFRDGVDITPEQFYKKLETAKVFPHTSVPPPGVFAKIYDKLASETEEILVITVSSKLTATYDVALQGINLMNCKCHIEVIDSRWATMAQGFVVMAAARASKIGSSFEEVRRETQRMINRVEFHATFDTLEYLRRGGRIGRAGAFIGSILKVNPIITLKDGVVEPVGRVRSRAHALDQLFEFARSCPLIEEMAVEDTNCSDEADTLVERLGSLFPKERIYRSKMTPAVGTHTGPGLLLIAIQGELHPHI